MLAVLWITLRIALRIALQPDAPSPPAEAPAARPGAYARTLPAGACVVEPFPDGYVFLTSCEARHGSEIVANLAYPAAPDAAYPAIPEFFGRALDLCKKAFEAYVGGPADQSRARFFVVRPPATEWRAGERMVVCYAGSRDDDELTTSIRARRP